jgi:MurNAc alpha-1-phosphate uridylyltransferase
MKLTKGMILAAGFGRRLKPITNKKPKPLIKIGKTNLLEKCILMLKNFGINEIVINTHYLSDEIINFINNKNFNINIEIINEEKTILDTGGGVLNATKKFLNDPFIVINPDTVWNEKYIEELENLEKIYFDKKKSSLLLVNKNKSFDKSFLGDFNLNDKGVVSRNEYNSMIYTGAQIINRQIFKNYHVEPFSMNKVWDELIKNKLLYGFKSNLEFFHLNSHEIYKKIVEKFNE